MTTWAEFSPRELRESGTLWKVNVETLWPLGMSLQVDYDEETDTYGPTIRIRQILPSETIVDGVDTSGEMHPALRFARWSRARRAACVIGDARAVFKALTGEDAPWPVDS